MLVIYALIIYIYTDSMKRINRLTESMSALVEEFEKLQFQAPESIKCLL